MFGNAHKPVPLHQRHVHPFVAWMAIVNFALVFSLAPSLIYAQTGDENANVNVSAQVLPQRPQVSACRQACYDAYGACSKAATDDASRQQCVSAGKECIDKCPDERPQGDEGRDQGGDKPKPQVSACRQACYATYNGCVQSAGDDHGAVEQCGASAKDCVSKCPPQTPAGGDVQKPKLSACRQACYDAYGACAKSAADDAARQQCGVAGMDCVSKCPQEKPQGDDGQGGDKPKTQPSACTRSCYDARTACVKSAAGDHAASEQCSAAARECVSKCPPATASATDKTAHQTYLDALAAAKQAYQDAMKKAQSDYQAALKQAQSDYAAAKGTTK